MKTINLLLSALSLIFTLFIGVMGLNFLILSSSEAYRSLCANIIQNAGSIFGIAGLILLVLSGGLFISLSHVNSKNFLEVKMGRNAYSIDERLIDQYVAQFWSTFFHDFEVAHQVTIRKNKIEITATLPHTPEQEQGELLKKIETHLSKLFQDQLGYKQEFTLVVSFEAAEKKLLATQSPS